MKTQNRTIITFIILLLIAPVFLFAQDSSTSTDEQVLPARPEQRSGETSADYTSRLRAWQAEVKRIADSASVLPERPEQRPGESAAAYTARLRNRQAQVNPLAASDPNIPDFPEQRTGESAASYVARLRQWDAQVKRITAAQVPASSLYISEFPELPARRPGESDDAYNQRIIVWHSQIENQAKLTQDLQKLIVPYQTISTGHPWPDNEASRSTGSIGAASENIIVIPTQEIKAEDLLTINEDLNIMSQIFRNELNQKGINLSNYGSVSFNGPYGSTYASTGFGLITGRDTNTLSSMYLQDYGALFLMNVDFPLSAPPETQEQPQEPNKEEVDQVWEQTKQQIYQPQTASTGVSTRPSQPQIRYDAKKVDNLKTTLITTLKHASNIRALKPDEFVTVRITGSAPSITIVAVNKQEKETIITYESGAVRRMISVDNPDFLKSIAASSAIVIRAKKSNIDAYAKGELSLDKFRDTVDVFSYPLLNGNGTN